MPGLQCADLYPWILFSSGVWMNCSKSRGRVENVAWRNECLLAIYRFREELVLQIKIQM